jgi:hypothetical protein
MWSERLYDGGVSLLRRGRKRWVIWLFKRELVFFFFKRQQRPLGFAACQSKNFDNFLILLQLQQYHMVGFLVSGTAYKFNLLNVLAYAKTIIILLPCSSQSCLSCRSEKKAERSELSLK